MVALRNALFGPIGPPINPNVQFAVGETDGVLVLHDKVTRQTASGAALPVQASNTEASRMSWAMGRRCGQARSAVE